MYVNNVIVLNFAVRDVYLKKRKRDTSVTFISSEKLCKHT